MSQANPHGSYPSMPDEPYGASTPAGPPPPTVSNAVKLMLVRAALTALSLVLLAATRDSLREAITQGDSGLSARDLDTAVTFATIVGVGFGLVFTVLYVMLALQVRKGKNWARIVTWVIAGLSVLSTLGTLGQPQTGAARVLSLVTVLIDLAIMVLLALKPSNDFFRSRR